MSEQLTLFGEQFHYEKANKGCSQSADIFFDYESFRKKFNEKEKTTDDCYTPEDVYEAVLEWVGERYDLNGKVIQRPFYPNGDYKKEVYYENGVVIDNPPFSIQVEITKFYVDNNIPFFLFANGMTVFASCKLCCAVVCGVQIEYHNGAKVRTNFITNLFDAKCIVAGSLLRKIEACPSQMNKKKPLKKFAYPTNIFRVSEAQTLAVRGVDTEIRNAVHNSNPVHGQELFGDSLIISDRERAKIEAIRNGITDDGRSVTEKPIQLYLNQEAAWQLRTLNKQDDGVEM